MTSSPVSSLDKPMGSGNAGLPKGTSFVGAERQKHWLGLLTSPHTPLLLPSCAVLSLVRRGQEILHEATLAPQVPCDTF